MSTSTVARKGARSLTFRVLTAVSDTLVVVVTARAFGAEGRGLYALASFTGSALVATLGGTATALAGEIAHKRASRGRLHAVSVLISLIGGGLVGAILAGVAIATWPHARVLLFAAVAAPVFILNALQVGIYQAEGDVRRMHYAAFGMSAIPLLALTVVAIAEPDNIYLALGIWAASQWIVPLLTLGAQRRQGPFLWDHMRELSRRILRRGLPVSLGNGIALLNYRVDLLVVTALLPLADVGRYSVAIAMGESLLILSRAINTATYAPIIGLPDDESVRLVARGARHALVLLVSGSIVLVGLAVVLLVPVFGSAFAGVWLPLAVLTPGIAALGGINEFIRIYFLIRLERSREYLRMATGAMVINLVLAFALTPSLGLAGAALSTTVSYVGGAAYLLARLAKISPAADARDFVPRWQDVRYFLMRIGAIGAAVGARLNGVSSA